MPGRDYERVARALQDVVGLGEGTPCLIVSQASTPQESIFRADLASLGRTPALPAPALLIVGEVAAAANAEAASAIVESVVESIVGAA